jgi:hypothetical protein
MTAALVPVELNASLPGSAEQLVLPLTDRTPLMPAPVEHGQTGLLRDRSALFIQAITDVLAGSRPAHQIAGWMTPEVFGLLRRQLAIETRRGPDSAESSWRTRGKRPRVASVRIFMVNDHAAEISARVVDARRSRAVALRLELQDDHRDLRRWCATAIQWA